VLYFKLADMLPSKYESPDNVKTFEYRVFGNRPGVYTNKMFVELEDPNPQDGNKLYNYMASKVVTVRAENDIEVTKSIYRVSSPTMSDDQRNALLAGKPFRDSISVGDLVTYRVTVKNVGENTCPNVKVYDTWPTASVALRPDDPRMDMSGLNWQTLSDGLLEVEVGNLSSGQEVDYDVTVQMIDDGYQMLQSKATTSVYEFDTVNNVASLRIYVRGLSIYPTTITPNGDGINDYFEVALGLTYPDNEIWIFNRTGNMVYHQKGYYDQFNGAGLPDGTFVYIFVYKDNSGKTHTLNGTIWITRQ